MDVSSEELFRVVVNGEEQYSIWPVELAVPAGWTADGYEGPRSECLDHIGSVWTDMRPRNLRGDDPPAGTAGAAGR